MLGGRPEGAAEGAGEGESDEGPSIQRNKAPRFLDSGSWLGSKRTEGGTRAGRQPPLVSNQIAFFSLSLSASILNQKETFDDVCPGKTTIYQQIVRVI